MLRATRRAFVVGVALSACSRSAEPVDPVWGKQPCESCRMLVSDPFYAAELIDENGTRHFFDDVGCLDAYLVEHPNSAPRGMWVHSNARWVNAESARYTAGATTPMGYGFAAQELGPLDFTAVRRGAATHRKEASR